MSVCSYERRNHFRWKKLQRTEIRRMREDPIIVSNEKSLLRKSVTRNEIHRRQSFRFRHTSHLTRSVYMLKHVLLSSYNNCQTCCNIDESSCKRNETYPQLCSTKREKNHSDKTHSKAHPLKKSNSLQRGMPLIMLTQACTGHKSVSYR